MALYPDEEACAPPADALGCQRSVLSLSVTPLQIRLFSRARLGPGTPQRSPGANSGVKDKGLN